MALPQPQTAADVARTFLAGYANAGTRRYYQADLDRLFSWLEGRSTDPLDASRPDLESYLHHLHSSGLASSSVARAASVAGVFYAWAEEVSYLARSPLRGVRLPKAPSTSRTVGLSRTEALGLLEAAETSRARDHLLICLLLLNARRVSEACGARVEHLAEERGHRTLRVRVKGGDHHWIALAPRTCLALDDHLEERGTPLAGPLVASLRPGLDGHLTSSGAHRVLTRVAKAAGIARRVHPHALRHTAITLALDAGVPLRDVQDLAGHANPTTTRRYDRARHSLDRHATYRLADYLQEDGLKREGEDL